MALRVAADAGALLFLDGSVSATVRRLARIAPLRRQYIMHAKGLIPILNVSDIEQSFAWFQKLGWKKSWDWGDPPDFGAVCSGESEIFLCLDGQGGRATPHIWGCLMSANYPFIHNCPQREAVIHN
jgi:hypothetical protein